VCEDFANQGGEFFNEQRPNSTLTTAVKVNFLSPNPYLFWFIVGGTYIARGTTDEVVTFIVVFLASLVLSKMAIALLTHN